MKHCLTCDNTLSCSCGTWDSKHEFSCELNSSTCEDCLEHQASIDACNEPPIETDYVKDLTLAEIDALVAIHQTSEPGHTATEI